MQTEQRVVFAHTMEALLDRCARGLTDAQWAELATLGISRAQRLPAYEFSLWCRAIEFVARCRHPEQPIGDAEYNTGLAFIEAYVETFVGRALFAMLRLLGTKRTVHRLTRSFRTGTNFTEVDIREETDSSCQLEFSVVEPRGKMTHAVLARGLELAGVPGLHVDLESLDGEKAYYRLNWSRG